MTDLETLGPPPRQVPLLTVLTLICHGPLGVIGWVFLGIGMLFASFTMSPSAIALGLVLMVDHEFVDGTVTAIEETSVSINEAEVLAVHVVEFPGMGVIELQRLDGARCSALVQEIKAPSEEGETVPSEGPSSPAVGTRP